MLKIKFLVIAVAISFAGILSSCYYDYGIDPNDSNIVVTLYDNTYDFSNVTKYILSDTVKKVGSSTITDGFDNLILTNVTTQLNNLGWTPATAEGPGVVRVGTGITTSTYTVDYNDYYWYGGGYYWGYPSYGYDYTYSYTTGTIIIAIADPNNKNGDQQPVEWSGFLNGVTGQNSPQALIQSGIVQAFSRSQSPYLYE